VDTLFGQLSEVKQELDQSRESLSEKQKHRLQLTLRLLSKTFAEVLSLQPEELTEDGILIIITRAAKAAPRRYRDKLPRLKETLTWP